MEKGILHPLKYVSFMNSISNPRTLTILYRMDEQVFFYLSRESRLNTSSLIELESEVLMTLGMRRHSQGSTGLTCSLKT